FEKLLGLRADVERSLDKLLPRQTPERATPLEAGPQSRPPQSAARPHQTNSPKASPKAASPAALDFEGSMGKIWDQLIAAPPSRGRAMPTIGLGAARMLMSSWEVAAFVREDGPSAEDLRRAVVARALVTASTESARETGNATVLDRALTVARLEVTRLLERVDAAKQAKDTEAPVNLGIDAKRLVSAIGEAEKPCGRWGGFH